VDVTDQSVTQSTHNFGHGVVHDRHVTEFFNILLNLTFEDFVVRMCLRYYFCAALAFPLAAVSQNLVQRIQRPSQIVFQQQARELEGAFDVMMISLQPGYEDASVLAYFRQVRGAKVVSVYVTNGEEGESDNSSLYPHQLAGLRRSEAYSLNKALDCEIHFLNLPDIISPSDTTRIRKIWDRDQLVSKLSTLLSQYHPDVVLLSRDPLGGSTSPLLTLLRRDLLAAERRAALFYRWPVNRVFLEGGAGKTFRVPLEKKNPANGKSYEEIGETLLGEYSSLSVQRKNWTKRTSAYSLIHLETGSMVRFMDEGLPRPSSRDLRSTEALLKGFLKQFAGFFPEQGDTSAQRLVLNHLTVLMDSLDRGIAQSGRLTWRDTKKLVHWKSNLERVRNTILGVSVSFALTDTVVAPLQLSFLSIDSVAGIHSPGTTEIYFPGVQQQWVINEGLESRLPLTFHTTYRLLSPRTDKFDLPLSEYWADKEKFVKPFYFLILHRAADRVFNFSWRQRLDIFSAPKFVVEVLTPFIRVRQGEQVRLRLTNNSRDGVRDSIYIADSLGISGKKQFRLSQKGAQDAATLTLTWKNGIPNGTFVLPVLIDKQHVASVVARKFDVQVDSLRPVAIVSSFPTSPLVVSLQRLGMTPVVYDADSFNGVSPEQAKVLFLDHRVFSLRPKLLSQRKILGEYVQQGGHLVVLSQDANAWNDSKLWEGIWTERTNALHPDCRVLQSDRTSLFKSPNKLTKETWQDWLFSLGSNRLSGADAKDDAVLLTALSGKGRFPLIVSRVIGSGRITYVDLDLHHQLLNLHEGAFRLLANLVSF